MSANKREFRIVEIKKSNGVSAFYPQYRYIFLGIPLGWYNWTGSYNDDVYKDSFKEASDFIKNKQFVVQTIIHKVDF